MKKLFLSLILILLVSGCSRIPFLNIFASQGPTVVELPSDVISITNVTVLPSTTVRVNDEFSVFFELLNQDEFIKVPVDYNLYDTGLCDPIEGEPPITGAYTIGTSAVFPGGDFFPQETRLVIWTFKAPSAEEIAAISLTCPIRFKFDFPYNATTEIDVLVISEAHLEELQRAGTARSFKPTINVGRGPLKIYFDFGTSLPVKDTGYPLPVYVTVENKGTGLLSEILSETFTITFPSEFDLSSARCPYFSRVGDSSTFRNNDDIPIINKKSLEVRCIGIKTRSLPEGIPERTYFITASIDYDYYSTGEVNVKIVP